MNSISPSAGSPPLQPNQTVDARWLDKAMRAAGPPLLFGLRLWASVSLALYIAFWLQLDNPFWAGTSAAIVCQPQLGASLRKGWFRVVGTLIGAVMSMLLTACFPQDRALFLGALVLWCAICAVAATLLRNFASYAAALSGYTVAIIAGDLLGCCPNLHFEKDVRECGIVFHRGADGDGEDLVAHTPQRFFSDDRFSTVDYAGCRFVADRTERGGGRRAVGMQSR